MERFREELRRYVEQTDDFDRALALALERWPSEPAYTAAFSGRLILPAPYPAAWMSQSLSQADRAVRWAIRASEQDATLRSLRQRGARAVGTRYGLRVVEVEPGSFRFLSEGSDRLYEALNKKPVVFALALLSALALLGYEPHIVWGDDDRDAPIVIVHPPDIDVDVNIQQSFTFEIEVEGETITVVSSAPTRRAP